MTKERELVEVRPYRETDAEALAAIYYHTIHTVNAEHYSQEQREAWAPASSLDAAGWKKKWASLPPLVAVAEGAPVGFVELEDSGHIDCFYCHHEWQGKGVGSALMNAVVREAKVKGIERLFAEVSITARPFFAAKGFELVKEQTVKPRGIEMTNFVMERRF